jgi:protein TonB
MKFRRPPRHANRARLPAAYGLSLAAHVAVLVAIGVGVWEAPRFGIPSPHWKAAATPVLQLVAGQDEAAPAAAPKEERVEPLPSPPPEPTPEPALVSPSPPVTEAKRRPEPAGAPSPPAVAASPPEGAFAPSAPAAEPGWPLYCPRPAYPAEARRRGAEGLVKLELLVNPRGVVESVFVRESSGHALLDRAALEAVRRWRLQPSRVGSECVPASVTLPIRFRLEDRR